MALTLSAYDAVLKDFYEGAVREQLNNEVPMFRILEEADKPWSGRRVVFPVHGSRNSGVGARAEAAALPTAGNQGTSLAVVSATYQYGKGRLSGQTLAAGKNAFAEALTMEMDGLMNDLKVDLGRQTWGVGDGRLAQISLSATAGTGSVSCSLFNRFFEPGQPGARFISVGMVVDIGAIGQAITAVSQTISAVSISSNPATTSDEVTFGNSACTFSSSEQFLYNRGAGGSGAVGLEMLGLQAIVDTHTQGNIWGSNAFWSASLQNISRSGNTFWNGQVMGNSQVERIIDSNLMQTAFDNIHQDTGLEPDIIMGHHSVVRALLDSVVADRRYVQTGTPKYDAGLSGLTYNGIPIERDRLAPFNTLFIGRKDALKKFTLKPIGFADKDGAILSRIGGTTGTDEYEFFLSMYANLGCVGYMRSLLMIRDIKTDL